MLKKIKETQETKREDQVLAKSPADLRKMMESVAVREE